MLTAGSGALLGAPLAWVAEGLSLDCCRGHAAQLVAVCSTPVVRVACGDEGILSAVGFATARPESHAATHRAWGSKLGCATQHGPTAASCSLWAEREAGSLELDAMEQYAVSMLRIAVGEGGAWPSQRTRGDDGGGRARPRDVEA